MSVTIVSPEAARSSVLPGCLENKVAIVTGSGTGIGRAIALRFAQEGARVVVNSRTESNVRETVEMVAQIGGQALAFPADITDRSQVERMVRRTLDEWGRIDILVNNAAVWRPVPFGQGDFNEWFKIFEADLMGAVHCCWAVVPHMVQQQGGRIVNISSINAYRALAESTHYNVAKGGLDQLTRCLALDLAPYNILVNSVAPGFIHTPMSSTGGECEFETDWFNEIYVKQRKLPLARPGQPEEVAEVALFLVSPNCTYITGQVIAVDGGLSATW